MSKELEAQHPQNLAQAVWRQIFMLRISGRRAAIVLALLAAMGIFLAWLPPGSRVALAISLLANRTLVVLLLFFSLLALSLFWSSGQRIDAWVFSYFNLHGYHPRWMDRLMWLITQIGNMGLAAIVAALSYQLGDKRFAILLMLGVLSLWLFVEAVKALTDRARPFKVLENTRIIGWRERGQSFPSGHTAQAFFVMSLFVHHLELDPAATAVLFAVAALVGLTRIYVGAHYPRDVLAGAFLGSVWGILSALIPPYV